MKTLMMMMMREQHVGDVTPLPKPHTVGACGWYGDKAPDGKMLDPKSDSCLIYKSLLLLQFGERIHHLTWCSFTGYKANHTAVTNYNSLCTVTHSIHNKIINKMKVDLFNFLYNEL
jgi:hypothetical protein